MIEVDFKDRVPSYPGRVKMTPVSGQMDVFTIERMDEPTESGTPLDKATFDSFLQSRLTGRYYEVEPVLTVENTTVGNVSPLPTSNWVLNGISNATSGVYKVEANSTISSNYSADKAVDNDEETGWGADNNVLHAYTITFPVSIEIKKIGLLLGNAGDFTDYKMSIQGANDGTTWTDLFTTNQYTYVDTEYTLTTTGEYNRYRLRFETPSIGRIYIFKITIPEWEANTYSIDFVADNMPLQWDIGQRVTVQIPDYAAFIVDSNTFNGVKVNTILLSGRKYELRYNGSAFDAKEV